MSSKLNDEFLPLAESVKTYMEKNFSEDFLQNGYIYKKVLEHIEEWKTGNFKSNYTDIGTAASQIFDGVHNKHEKFCSDISQLSFIYRTRHRRPWRTPSSTT